ncbi:NAD(P)H:quinone oxidoreductase [Candidatus Woesebacteria bacterium]|nr:NAD(P)H:quinone oxidoreductase [Candidatus Woesebacteria bacterium]
MPHFVRHGGLRGVKKFYMKVLVLFYSLTGKTAELARSIAQGVESVPDTEVEIKRIPEILPDAFFENQPSLRGIKESLVKEFPEATAQDVIGADGIALGSPTHFGSLASQVKHFLDQFTPVWMKGDLTNKPVSFFCSAGATHGGEELTLLSMIIPALNLGMIPVGIPYPIVGESPDFDAGSPYGAVYVTGSNRQLSDPDKKVAKILGRRLAAMTHIMGCDNEKCAVSKEIMKKLEV